MSDDSSMRGRALQSRDAVELLSSKWRITLLHLLVPDHSDPRRCDKLLRIFRRRF